jgi:hypothetical protein
VSRKKSLEFRVAEYVVECWRALGRVMGREWVDARAEPVDVRLLENEGVPVVEFVWDRDTPAQHSAAVVGLDRILETRAREDGELESWVWGLDGAGDRVLIGVARAEAGEPPSGG